MNERPRLVVLGCGMAGAKLVEELLARDAQRFHITIVGDEAVGNYNRIKLVVKLKEPALPEFFLNPPEWFTAHGAEALLGTPAAAIDRAGRVVRLANGRTVSYDRLALATGAKPFIPPMNGLDLPGVFALRRLEHVARIREFLADKSRVCVVGGGLLGLELALMLRLIGKTVTIVHLMPTLMEMQLPADAARFLQRHLEALGIRIVTGTYITDLLGSTAGVAEVRCKDGAFFETDAVFFNCGIRPNADLARAAGLVCNKGVAVDEFLQTSDPLISACGECMEHQGRTWGLVAPCYEQAQVLAANLCGEPTPYRPSPPAPTRLKSDIPVVSMGRFLPEAADEVTLYVDPASAVSKQLIIRDGLLQGAVLVGEDLNADVISLHYSARLPAPPRRADLLFPGARAGEAIVDGKLIPDSTLICECAGVSAGKIRKAIREGCDTLYKVMGNTRAGAGCGNCKSKIKALLIAEVGELRLDPAERWFAPGIPLEREPLSALIREKNLRSVSQVLAAVPGSVADSKTRMSLDFLLNYIWKGEYTVENDARCANDRFSGNIQNDGRYSVIPDIPGGVATSAQLRALADVADRHGAMIKITGADRIGLFALPKAALPAAWKDLQMHSGHAFTKCFRACKACVGSTHCRFGLGDSLGLGRRLGQRYRGTMGPGKFKMGVSGCLRNCSEATIKDLGVIAVEGGWEVFVGGNGGARVSVGRSLGRFKTEDEVIPLADRVYEYYRRHARYGERTAAFIDRIGFETLLNAVVRASATDQKELEESLQQALRNCRDPWEHPDAAFDNEAGTEVSPATAGYVALASVADIPPGGSRLFRVGDWPVALFHGRDGSWVAAHGLCPHKQGPLVDSIYGGGRLTCPVHTYSFDVVTGKCDNPEVAPLTIYAVQVQDGKVLVQVTGAR